MGKIGEQPRCGALSECPPPSDFGNLAFVVMVQTERGQASFFLRGVVALPWRGRTGRQELGPGLSGVG